MAKREYYNATEAIEDIIGDIEATGTFVNNTRLYTVQEFQNKIENKTCSIKSLIDFGRVTTEHVNNPGTSN